MVLLDGRGAEALPPSPILPHEPRVTLGLPPQPNGLTFYLRQAPLGLLRVFSLLLELVQLGPEELAVVSRLLPQVSLLRQLGLQLADPALQL